MGMFIMFTNAILGAVQRVRERFKDLSEARLACQKSQEEVEAARKELLARVEASDAFFRNHPELTKSRDNLFVGEEKGSSNTEGGKPTAVV